MRLISQDGGIDLQYENVILEAMYDCKSVFAHTGTGQSYRMAKYSSAEQMDKVMDMLRCQYTKEEVQKVTAQSFCEALKTLEEQGYSDSVYNEALENAMGLFVFQFTEDDEVKV